MARTKGAKDNHPRKKPTGKRPPQVNPQRPPASPSDEKTGKVPTPPPAAVAARPAIPPSDFKAAIAAELAKEQPAQPGRVPDADPSSGGPPTAPAGFDPAALTLEGLANAWQLPFYGLAKLLQVLRLAPSPGPIIAVGKSRAPEMAKASYPIYEHYARQYVNVHPDQAVNASIGVTLLDGIGIVPDLIDAVMESRADAARAAARTAPPQPDPVPASS
jgi:hypothetical protein